MRHQGEEMSPLDTMRMDRRDTIHNLPEIEVENGRRHHF